MWRILTVAVLLSALVAFLVGPAAGGPVGPTAAGGDHDIPQFHSGSSLWDTEDLDAEARGMDGSGPGSETVHLGNWASMVVQTWLWLHTL